MKPTRKLAEFKDSKLTGIEIYIDDSKDNDKVAAAAVINKYVFSARLPDKATIFSAEAKACFWISVYKDV